MEVDVDLVIKGLREGVGVNGTTRHIGMYAIDLHSFISSDLIGAL